MQPGTEKLIDAYTKIIIFPTCFCLFGPLNTIKEKFVEPPLLRLF